MDKLPGKIELSVVIPVYGSAAILPELVRQLHDVLTTQLPLKGRFEILLVNDCGPGDAWSVIRKLAQDRSYLKGVGLRKNAGQHNAVMAGLNYASGDVIVIMDDDLQHSPYDIPILYQKLNEGYDVCYATFGNRQHAMWKVVGSAFNDRVAQWLLKKPAGLYLSPFKALRAEIRDELIKYQGPYVYLDGLILSVTGNIATIEVKHHPRHEGGGSYNLRRSISLWLKMATSFSITPLRFASLLGLTISFVGTLWAVYIAAEQMLNKDAPLGWTSLVVIVLILGGIQLLALGAIGEYLGRVFLSINRRPQFVVASTMNLGAKTTADNK